MRTLKMWVEIGVNRWRPATKARCVVRGSLLCRTGVFFMYNFFVENDLRLGRILAGGYSTISIG